MIVLGEQGRRVRFLLRDRDTKFCRGFDEVFWSQGAAVLRTPVQAPNANAFAERWIATVRAECLDWLLIVGRSHLEQVLRVYASTTTRTDRIGRLGWRRHVQPLGCTSSTRVAKPGYSDVTCSAGSSTVPASCMNGFPHPTGSRGIQKDRLDDHRDDQGTSDKNRMARQATSALEPRPL
jgi:hypothetical protein